MPPALRRIGWFIAFWVLGVGAVTLIGLAIRWALVP